jgi:putative transposase
MDETKITCPHCGLSAVTKFGHYKGAPRYWCKVCQRKFKSDGTLFHMKTPANQVASALSMYYEGMSQNAIRRQLQQDYGNYPSDATVYEWILKYTNIAVKEAKDYHPHVGDTWIADETYVRVDKKKPHDAAVGNPYSKSKKAKWVVFWDIIDAKTRFLLASHITTTRGTKDAQALMEKAAIRAGKIPRVIVTDKLSAYLDGIELTFGADTKHKQGAPFDIQNNTNLIERFHGTLKTRTKVMRALKNRDTLEKFADGWLVHYNFLRPHEALKGKTPAEVANAHFTYKNWFELTSAPQVIITQNTKPLKTSPQRIRSPRAHELPKITGDIYASKDVLSRRPFKGAKRIRRRVL